MKPAKWSKILADIANRKSHNTLEERDRQWNEWIKTPEALAEILADPHGTLAVKPSQRGAYILKLIKGEKHG